MVAIGTVDERFQSYNVEMVEVTAEDFGSLWNERFGVGQCMHTYADRYT